VRLLADGRAVVSSATHDLGTGAYTIFTQVAAQTLGLPAENVRFELGDSDLPYAMVAGGSNTTATVSQAVLEAAQAVKAKLLQLAAADARSPLHGLGADQVGAAEGRLFATADPARGEPFSDLLTRSGQPALEATSSAQPGAQEQKQFSFNSFGAQFCEVKIDPQLPRVRVTRFVSVIDNGRVLNFKTCRSQVLGGVVMGLGMALMEHTVYDPRTGRPVTDNLADYAVPVNADVASIEPYFIDRPDPHINALGCRGVGEIGITGVAAAVANAVFHATGKRVRDLPITPDKLLV
jgi:xanthine dehydrogenase YagR molybdenum-binding subunit